MACKIDATNKKILHLLWKNARLSYAEIGKLVHLSAPAVAERVRKMEDAGIISGYRVQVNLAATGYPVTAFILVKVFHGMEQAFMDFAATLPEVMVCHNVTGEKAFLVQISVPSVSRLDSVLAQFANLSETNTMVLLSTVVPPRLLPQPL